jgi:hypothetical protein
MGIGFIAADSSGITSASCWSASLIGCEMSIKIASSEAATGISSGGINSIASLSGYSAPHKGQRTKAVESSPWGIATIREQRGHVEIIDITHYSFSSKTDFYRICPIHQSIACRIPAAKNHKFKPYSQ